MIPENFISQLKGACDIVSVVSSYVPLKNEGRNKKCLCPFHMEKTPSFVLYEDTQSFYCFGCGAGGDVINFIERIENLDYVESVKLLAQRAGMTVPENGQDDRFTKQRAKVLEMNKLAARYYFEMLKKPEGKAGLEYFLNRKLSKQTIIKFGLGFAPDSWNHLRDYLKSKGYSYEDMLLADLVAKSKKGTFYDKFRNRAVFPIIDLRGNVIAFGGRVLDDSKPKYLNSSDTPVFKKSKNLFALNFAKNSGKKTLILGEGYMDVIAMNQAGFENSVATLGTALTPEQARLISRYADDVIIAYDSDEAGRKATERASNLFEQSGVEAKVLKLNNAKDPDEYIQKNGAGRFSVLLDQSLRVSETKIESMRSKYNLSDPEEMRKYVDDYCKMIADMNDPLRREVYIGTLSAESNLPREVLSKRVERLKKYGEKKKEERYWKEITQKNFQNRDKINPDSIKYPKAARAEQGILHFLMQNPNFAEYITNNISADEFLTGWNKKVFEVVTKRLLNNMSIDISTFHSIFSPDEISKLSELINTKRDNANTKEALDDYIAVVKREHSKLTEDISKMTPQEIERRRLRKLGNQK